MSNMHCKSCSEVLDERLVVCPKCGANPRTGEKVILSEEQFTLIWKRVRSKFVKGAIFGSGIVSLVFGLGLWQVYDKTMDSTETFV